ncbi:S9 family peptidase [Rhodocytophaga rosea]|uniref:S9 family peptidase n=1 Tax=Rhodocytophaga rosea TaxID=2704465 RepID=A0A6C0GNL9_9BACT|nr:S9 family peptidase [Rhodocytophaga rosea]QHT69638.1 S9 family peptidase [Rhodocytophaga rosea]
MKPIFTIATCLLTVALFSTCQKAGNETKDQQTAGNTESVKQYTIEQFMNTSNAFGSSFSPDEQKILFSTNKTGIYNGFEVAVTGGEAKALTSSKDNSVFAISYFPYDERILYSSDKGGNEISHIYVKNTDGTMQDLTPDSTAKSEFFAWSFDEKSFFYVSNKRDRRYFDLYEMDIATFKPVLVYKNDKGYDVRNISNDKAYLSLVKSYTTNNTDMYLYDIKKKQQTLLSKHTGDVNFSPATFSSDSKKLLYLTDENNEFAYLKSYEIGTGKVEEVEKASWDIMYSYYSRNGKYRVTAINNDARTEIKIYDGTTSHPVALAQLPAGDIMSVDFSKSEKRMAFYLRSATSPGNLYVYDFDTKKATRLTDTISPDIEEADLVAGEVIRYKSFDGMEIPAILYKSKGIESGEKRPALLEIHGGPGGQTRVNYDPLIQYLVNHGYVILAVNNRGSSGYGKTFLAADDLKHGDVDLKDCIESKKFLNATGYVDSTKIGIMGGSYGGYMTLAALAFAPQEFEVGVDIFGVANWLRTLNSIPPYWESFREALYKELGNPKTDSVALYNKSPLFHAGKIVKPLIVLQGANDPRVLKVESDEMVEAVKKNNVPVEYLVFPDEGHGFVKKENEIKGYKAILDFVDKHLMKKAI